MTKAQQAKQRQELLAHAQSFLNPQKKPATSSKSGVTPVTTSAVSTPAVVQETTTTVASATPMSAITSVAAKEPEIKKDVTETTPAVVPTPATTEKKD